MARMALKAAVASPMDEVQSDAGASPDTHPNHGHPQGLAEFPNQQFRSDATNSLMDNPLQIRAEHHDYPVYLGHGLLSQIGWLIGGHARRLVKAGARCAVITDTNVAPLYGATAEKSLRSAGFAPTMFVVAAGEASKSLAELGQLAELLAASGLDRSGFIVALGGGVIGDLAGFLASVFHRGIPFVQVPTTVVAQVDSSVGGKTGVNLPTGKNLLGTFYPPAMVIADVHTLGSLPDREFNEGMAEAIKHAVIRDAGLLKSLKELDRTNAVALAAVIRRNLEIKAGIVASDEFERDGTRALLNFGHTVGHAIEQAAGYGQFLHGEAVSLGLVAAARLSRSKANLSSPEYLQIIDALHHFRLPTELPLNLSVEAVLKSMGKDKKFEGGEVRFILTPRLGQAFVSTPDLVTWEDLRGEVEALRMGSPGSESNGEINHPAF